MARRPRVIACLLLALCLACYGVRASAQRAHLLFDVDTGAVLHAENANLPSYPASLTKLMTVYLLLEAIDAGAIALSDTIVVGEGAASQAPKRLGLKRGEELSLEEALLATILFSANDAAAAIAESVAGSEPAFVERMNEKAAALGMADTAFRNASGLPDPLQVTTARDMALLAAALHRDFRHHFHYFSRTSFSFRRRELQSHNNFVRGYRGSDGMKTGFTCRAGYNLVASAAREQRRFIGVVLGAKTAGRRDWQMVQMFDRAFAGNAPETSADLGTLGSDAAQGRGSAVNGAFIAEECINPRSPRGNFHVAARWSLEFGLEVEKSAAVEASRAFIDRHRNTAQRAKPLLIPRWARDVIYRVGVTDLSEEEAVATCTAAREADEHCIVLPPQTAEFALTQALRILELAAKASNSE